MRGKLAILACAALAANGVVHAQEVATAAQDDVMTAIPDPASIPMPDLAFTSTPLIEEDFDKYYVFNRAGTSFAEALTDIRDCDNLARGLDSGYRYQQAPYPYTYTMAGAAGGLIANALMGAIFGSSEKRRLRRVNMRRCMHYKGYERYGLAKEKWEPFNFEEGLDGVKEAERQRLLALQAKVASGPAPAGKGLGL
ncbi:MAG: hypothetical protein B7Y36_10905 [Novosphingobium sp. 28-62-57]|uniref:hypothetical protein n=1 Tax=unclassified Novosphingobium TaxID=2644732 RepID=UPI000BD0BDEC|nr:MULTISPECIES: hypothetical protein [unclassified Novosphingobium]OYW48263.1 MAG: hypothetical protein B7Z34_14800 [Novosphingobium sp. 12-62-10]OYZ10251.1 MAG: hypothetical protein B7Y36_10905 [Novosphingobium sp. 28-62-57]OZA38032.1 MAG: hypothetical protein B7X92_04095 [Novosphingobium sp. 17-62-9]HQS70502.1 hypothetical protein [Novosphingobium sp.]